MADSLFDNRYRYDYIYPRGRSGETLRAVDTAENDRPVVIKRPAPNDAPPIRAGQEVSILNERKVLRRLAGHPALTELLDEGQFFVGGVPHQYIVMERATGMIVADTVLTLSRSGERMPQLEMLVIVDSLLDLLEAAHKQDIVYNDVDAKHLFWSREAYRLKVIDWGNAVFLEGDSVTPQGISRQTDIFQVGELLFSILTGGSRAEVPRDAGADFTVNFGEDGARIASGLRSIVSRALHPNLRHRYQSIGDLRRELTDFRRPLERERNTAVGHVLDRLRRDLSKTELRGLVSTLEPALNQDPGYPDGRKARQEIEDRLRDLEVSADLDAVQIYMNGGNWSRAADLLNELRDKAGPQTSQLVELLLDCTMLLLDADLLSTPPAVVDAVDMMFEGHMVHAAHTLLTQDTPDDEARKFQWLMAERISSRIPEILLLRPNLYRLELALSGLEGDGVNISDAHTTLNQINAMLDDLPNAATNDLSRLRDGYRAVVDRLQMLNKLLSTLMVQQRLSNRRLPLSALDRATNAAMALADNMHVIGRQAASSPRDAMVALDNSRAIDPMNPMWGQLTHLLNSLYDLLQSYQTFVPAADGSDLAQWFTDAQEDLRPFTERLFDEMLVDMVHGLQMGAEAWRAYSDCVIQGNRAGALESLDSASSAVQTISPTLAGWLDQLRGIVERTPYVQRNAVFGGLGRALADGYEAFDRARLQEAEQLGQRAVEIATSEVEVRAARRLLDLSSSAREWLARNGASDHARTRDALNAVEARMTDEELRVREVFASQMPGPDTYLKAMGKGLVEVYQRTSTSALRLYFFSAILQGVLEAHDGNLEDARFWREAAVRSLGEYGQRHEATRTLDAFIEQRHSLNEAADLLNTVNNQDALAKLEPIKRKLADSVEARMLAPAGQSLRDLEAALREWADGNFRQAGQKLESAIHAAQEVEQTADIQLGDYVGWLNTLQAKTAELHTVARQMRQTIERRPADPVPAVQEAHRRLARQTRDLLGEPYHAQLQQWADTYDLFLAAYTDTAVRRSGRLARLNELFKALFIDRHPAYPLYRHWYDLTESAPEFPAPPTSEPTPRIDEADEEVADAIYLGSSRYEADEEAARPAPMPVRSIPWRLILLVLLVAGAVGGGLLLASGGLNDGDDDSGQIAGGLVTLDATETVVASPTSGAPVIVLTDPDTSLGTRAAVTEAAVPATDRPAGTEAPLSLITPTLNLQLTRIPGPSLTPSETPTPRPTDTPSPTRTPRPTNTPIPTDTPVPSLTPTPTLPPQGLQGWQSLLELLSRLDDYPWTEEQFSPAPGTTGWRLGVGGQGTGDDLTITLPAEVIDRYYGNNAPARIRRTEGTISLTTYDPTLIDIEDVYFGLTLRSVNDPSLEVGLYVQVVNLTTVNLYLRDGDELNFIVQRSENAIDPRIRLERDAVSHQRERPEPNLIHHEP
ncbi:MAG: hypothetical protein ACOCYT_02390, partial [Chloroflexota bacterium]